MRFFLVTAALFISATQAEARTVLLDNFDDEASGNSVARYQNFRNFTVSFGLIDLVGRTNPSGLACAGSTGSCVNLSSARAATFNELTTGDTFNFRAGDLVRLMVDVSTQTTGSTFNFGFVFDRPTNLSDIVYNYQVGGPTPLISGIYNVLFVGRGLEANRPFTSTTFTFRARDSGSFTANISGSSRSPFGPVIDNFQLDIISSAVPEPSIWLTMLVGFAAIGATMRSRRKHGYNKAILRA